MPARSKLKKKIIFTEGNKKYILESFDKKVDSEGYIVEKSKPEQRVLTPDGHEITLKEFAGLRKGSEVFIKSDIHSLIKLSDNLAK